MTRISDLPVEILDYILEFSSHLYHRQLYDNALVCREWHAIVAQSRNYQSNHRRYLKCDHVVNNNQMMIASCINNLSYKINDTISKHGLMGNECFPVTMSIDTWGVRMKLKLKDGMRLMILNHIWHDDIAVSLKKGSDYILSFRLSKLTTKYRKKPILDPTCNRSVVDQILYILLSENLLNL